MFVVIVASLTFQRFWKRKYIIIKTDSQANITSMAWRACENKLVYRLIRMFISIQILGSFSLRLQYINTHDNKWADALLRGNPDTFTSEVKDHAFLPPIFLLNFPMI